jgi:cytochrome c oxidase cbb3-type subunit III
MRQRIFVAAILVFLATALTAAQQPPAPPIGGRGRIGGAGIGAYPERPPGDPAAIERGSTIYRTNCAFCHGQDTRGGDGGPSLLRSALVLADQKGELIAPVIQAGRGTMPKFALTIDQIADVAAFMHSFKVAGYDPARQKPTTILVGNPKAGETYFASRCASCHSATGDLQGWSARFTDERVMQQSWLMPGSMAGRGAPPPARPRTPSVTVTLRSGETITGELQRVDDFVLAIVLSDGSPRSFRIAGGQTTFEITDPLRGHRDLLKSYTDADIHNVTAFLATLK